LDFTHNRGGVGKFAGCDLGMNLLSINGDFEHAASGRNQLQRRDTMLEFEEFVRQTDGVRLVVSSSAILN
jgi:hypothetical protein